MFAGLVDRARLGAAVLTSAALLACGERAGDPVVALESDQNLAGADGGPDADSSGPIGLCGACNSSVDCGDANDACIRHQDRGFCGRDCEDQRGCPDGYECLELNDNRLRQCVPRTSCPEPRPAPSATELRDYVLERVNAERQARDQAPLEPSSCLDGLAQASALDFARTDEPLGKYVKECDPVWPACECGWSAEAEISISAYDLDWQAAIDRAVESSAASTNTRFVRALLAADATQIGVGFWLSGDELWIALSFA